MPRANGQHQRLVASLAADAAGYSRLMAVDASATVDALDATRQVFRSAIESHHGRVIDMAGDSVLAVFETAIGAVSAALEVQLQIEAAAATLPEERRMHFRIGVHLGDVVEKDDGSVYGDGVNIAARLQALAEPGGITVSDAVRGAVRNRLGVRFDDQGEQQVKNIADPVRASCIHAITVAATPAAATAANAGSDVIKAGAARWLAPRWWLAGILVLGLAAAGTWALLARPWASGATQASPYSLLVAVLPFVAAEARPADAALAEALAQSLTTNLGQVRTFKVAAPGHSTSEPGKAVDARRIGRELNVLYLVMGELRPQGDKLGVTARLVETENATQFWSQRYELSASPTSEQQSHRPVRLTRNVVNAVYGAAQDRAVKQPELLSPIDFVLRGNGVSPDDDLEHARQARAYYDKALQLDPNFVPAIVGRVWLLINELWAGSSEQSGREQLRAELDALTARAVALDYRDSAAWRARHIALNWFGRWGESFAANEKARTLAPWGVVHVTDLANLMSFTGRQAEAEPAALRAIEMDPPASGWEFRPLCQARLLMGRYAEALPDCERASTHPDPTFQMPLAAAYALTGDTARAAIVRAEVLKKLPWMTIANSVWQASPIDPQAYRQQTEEHLNPGLLKAGFPEK